MFVTRRNQIHLRFKSTQAGAVLVLAMIFLLLTTLVASTTFFGSFTETRKAGNFSAQTQTLEDAEAALRVAEAQLLVTNPQPAAPITSVSAIETNPSSLPIYKPSVLAATSPASASAWQVAGTTWWSLYGQEITTLNEHTENPHIIVEEIDFAPDSASLNTIYGQSRPGVIFYGVNSRNKGKLASTVTLQSTLGARAN